MPRINFVRAAVLIATAACCMFVGNAAGASEEGVDRDTQAALALDAHPDRGAAQFARYCARCHGSLAQGNAGRSIPSLAGQRFTYLVRQLADFAGGERASDTMHQVISRKEMREPQSWVDIAAYLNKTAPSQRAQTGDGMDLALGQGIFHEQCATCHRADAHGNGDGFVPSLRNQHYAYLVMQMHKLGEGYRHNVDENLMRFLQSFDDRDMSATADFLSRLRGRGAVHKIMRNDGVVVD
ncbi:MAG TPA: c-type cytochrome [Steroidobacteraceae bacterium]|jgi:cytochrome c553|nr:c-type cytochrome [Steroidobacteraceae bacterium]